MDRNAFSYLQSWLAAADRKPLVVRGARQVGKTWLVRHFAHRIKKQLIEVNFEKQPSQASLFTSNDPKQILLNLSTAYNQDINPKNSLLFLDEIQAAPQILSQLRWFAEDLPELPVITAGSLLEFLLASHSFSMPVGRISYLHLEPLSFEEFLLARDKIIPHRYLATYNLDIEIPLTIHQQLTALFKEYLLVGGLPAAVASWINEASLSRVNQIQHDLLATYRDDFSKYKGRMAIERLDEVLMAIPRMLGNKFVFRQVNNSVQSDTIKKVLDLLSKARICYPVRCCSANGIPLAAEVKEKYFKETLLDTGLCSAALGLNLNQINATKDINFINNGGIAEQVVGQMLRTINPYYMEPSLYYWMREEKGSSAEIDYVIAYGNQVVPVEVKAGSTGSLKSLHLFMELKNLTLAIRINSDLPSKTSVSVRGRSENKIEYQLLSIPFYMTEQIYRLLALTIA